MSTQSQTLLAQAIEANRRRTFYAAYPESPKAYAEDAQAKGLEAFQRKLNQNFEELQAGDTANWIGEEVSPYLQTGLGIHYPAFSAQTYIERAQAAWADWKNLDRFARTRKRAFLRTGLRHYAHNRTRLYDEFSGQRPARQRPRTGSHRHGRGRIDPLPRRSKLG
jgi:hypothetical protein